MLEAPAPRTVLQRSQPVPAYLQKFPVVKTVVGKSQHLPFAPLPRGSFTVVSRTSFQIVRSRLQRVATMWFLVLCRDSSRIHYALFLRVVRRNFQNVNLPHLQEPISAILRLPFDLSLEQAFLQSPKPPATSKGPSQPFL